MNLLKCYSITIKGNKMTFYYQIFKKQHVLTYFVFYDKLSFCYKINTLVKFTCNSKVSKLKRILMIKFVKG